MKKFLNLLMIIYVILIFTACTSEITSNSYDRSNPHTDVEQINLKMLTSVMGVDPGAQTDNGFYEIAYTGETSVNILYTDFESKTRVFYVIALNAHMILNPVPVGLVITLVELHCFQMGRTYMY